MTAYEDVPALETAKWQVCTVMEGYGRKCRHTAVSARRLTLVLPLVMVAGVIASPYASAAPASPRTGSIIGGGDGHGEGNRISVRSGNGRFNRNYSTVLSPTVNRGFQQVSNTNVSGRTLTQVAFCKKRHRVCRISQRLGTSPW
jgi:hypothetical protein